MGDLGRLVRGVVVFGVRIEGSAGLGGDNVF